ncbi:hypothetical protein OG552_10210 [Streptomyces sp. NBC_01476]|uniref:hypothetical protein n=1 Tax=Streptomyces sp. NBC_01476 TaxID=2903881 RepID=UPI002E378E6A|nr:hypothetical protein [Streptomyces sp. NBC_01476]
MTAPDVLYRHSDGRFDTTNRAWDARDVKPLRPDAKPRPLHHRDDCPFGNAAELTEVCPCTTRQRNYRAQHPGGGQ